jgi:predicted TIM-barrel fold metal-dependent hydrolase
VSNLAESVRVIDADSHLTEPPTLWVDELPAKWRDEGPRAEQDSRSGALRWRLGDKWLFGLGSVSHAGWRDFPPSRPPQFEDITPACYDPRERAKWLDEHNVTAQVLYPNLTAFEGHAIMGLQDPDLRLAILRVYNDYLIEFSSEAPGRFIPIASLPFWDIDASIAEMKRCAEMGHRGVLWAATLAKHGLPASTDPFWDRFYAAAEDMRMSINLHVGVGWTSEEMANMAGRDLAFDLANTAGRTALSWMSNAQTITDLIMDGVCERFPRLDFVSVESGFGWIPFLLDGLDWQWKNYDGPRVLGRLLPSEYFRRQIYGMFWFEESTLPLFARYADNIMFETDFPHTTSLSPGQGSASPSPSFVIERARTALDPETFEKVMYANAARVYGIDDSPL